MAVFVSMSDNLMAATIDAAHHRVLLATPGFRQKTANALERAVQRLGAHRVTAVVDCSEEVFRLGFGDMVAVNHAMEAGCVVRQSPGLRMGVLITDDSGWTFAPTALYIAAEVQSDETPNAIAVSGDTVERLVRALGMPDDPAPDVPDDRVPGVHDDPAPDVPEEEDAAPSERAPLLSPEVEIGVLELSEAVVEKVTRSLTEAPPVAFDIARKVRVYEPYIQYVEISLRGCAIQRHKLVVPRSIQGLEANTEVAGRLRTTFDVIKRDSDVSSKVLEAELKTLRDNLAPSMGPPWGRIVLRARRKLIEERIAEFRARVDAHREMVRDEIDAQLEKSRKELIDHFLPLAVRRPPDALLGKLLSDPSEDQVRAWLDRQLSSTFPKAADLIDGMSLDVQFRDVTYDTLHDKRFTCKLQQKFPEVDWDRPLKEFDAAPERNDQRQPAS